MGCTPNDLLGYSTPSSSAPTAERIGEPTVEKLVQCYVRSAGHISGFSDYLHYCQIYDEPKDERIFLKVSGRLALASRAANTTDVGYLQDQFFKFDAETRRAIYDGQRTAWENGFGVEAVFLNHPMPERGKRAKFDFLRAAFKTTMADNSKGLVVWCTVVDQ
ncbi:hypothetical protein GCM10007385_35190 [Tateyamaria omphalii]|nr:hypothetical protein GCM10007385_35190 [Tateyamaria omphalii]